MGRRKAVKEGLEALTPAERRVMDCVCEGWDNATIAGKLEIAPQTVKAHLYRVFGKLKVENRVQSTIVYKGGTLKSA